MEIALIAAMDKNGLIGNNNTIPWHIPNDLAYFRRTTWGKTVIMGRKTYESIGKPLPNRENVILTTNKNYWVKGCKVFHSIKDIFKEYNGKEVFIIGGREIYNLFYPYAKKMYLTIIDYEFEGDTYFPEIDFKQWERIYSIKGIRDEDNPYDYSFNLYVRKQSIYI